MPGALVLVRFRARTAGAELTVVQDMLGDSSIMLSVATR
jgi:hypothetical protein